MNKKGFYVALVIVGAIIVFGAINFSNKTMNPVALDSDQASSTMVAVRSISLEDVKNATYVLSNNNTPITLADGLYNYPGSPSAYVKLRSAAFGDLDGDGIGDAVVVLDNVPPQYHGLGGDYTVLFAVINKQGKPVSLEKGVDFGDGTATSNLMIKAKTISVFLENPGFTFNNTTKQFVIANGILKEVLK